MRVFKRLPTRENAVFLVWFFPADFEGSVQDVCEAQMTHGAGGCMERQTDINTLLRTIVEETDSLSTEKKLYFIAVNYVCLSHGRLHGVEAAVTHCPRGCAPSGLGCGVRPLAW